MNPFRARFICPLTVAVALSACDPFYGPVVTNAFETDMMVTVLYSDGQKAGGVWPSCHTAFIGRENLSIEKLTFEKDGRRLRDFTSQEVRAIEEAQEKLNGPSQWRIGPEGARLVVGKSSQSCP